jgi:hypothetical protein
MTGLHERRTQRTSLYGNVESSEFRDSTAHPDSMRAWLSGQPGEWVRVTRVEGQGFVILVPCYSMNSTLALQVASDSLPAVECEYCDNLNRFTVMGAARDRRDSSLELLLQPPAAELSILPVTDSLLRRYPEAPFQDRILLLTQTRVSAADSAVSDTMVFVPKYQENEFEVLRAEDENPEGCGPPADAAGSPADAPSGSPGEPEDVPGEPADAPDNPGGNGPGAE